MNMWLEITILGPKHRGPRLNFLIIGVNFVVIFPLPDRLAAQPNKDQNLFKLKKVSSTPAFSSRS